MANKLKIGLVLDDGLDKPDGVQQYILAIGTWLASQGHEVHYLVGQTSRTDIPNTHSLSRNVRVRSNGNHMTIPLPASRRRLRAFLQQQQFDVLHVQTPFSPFMGGRLVSLAPKRTAIAGTFHILPNSWFMSLGTWALGKVVWRPLKRIDVMLSVSSAAQKFAQRTFGVRSTVLPNVIDYPRFHVARPLPQYNDGVQTILFLGRLVPRKGCLTLLQAIKQIKNDTKLPPFRVVVCGRGPLEAQLNSYIQRHDLGDVVEMVGFVSEADKPRYYASADISVFPSNGGESFGIVLLEAMASGKAVVLAGDNPGYHTVMEPQPELLFNPSSSQDLAEKLREYLTDDARSNQLRAWGEDYTKAFDVDVVGQKLLEIYGQALRKRP